MEWNNEEVSICLRPNNNPWERPQYLVCLRVIWSKTEADINPQQDEERREIIVIIIGVPVTTKVCEFG